MSPTSPTLTPSVFFEPAHEPVQVRERPSASADTRSRQRLPLPPLVAGVLLCANVVLEPAEARVAAPGHWATGQNAPHRLFARARQSQSGTALAPNRIGLKYHDFPPPWRRLADAWRAYAAEICALDATRSALVAKTLTEPRVEGPWWAHYPQDSTVSQYVHDTYRLADVLLSAYRAHFSRGEGSPQAVARAESLGPGQSAAAPSAGMETFLPQLYAFGHDGARAIRTLAVDGHLTS